MDLSVKKESRIYPLRAMQRWLLDTQFMRAKSTMMNETGLMRLDASIDMELLASSINMVMESNDIFRCRFFADLESGDISQRFDGEIESVSVEMITDDELEKLKGRLKKHFEFRTSDPLYRIRLFRTPTAGYMYVDFFHALVDGVGIVVGFLGSMNSCYTKLKRDKEKGLSEPSFKVRSSSYESLIQRELDTPDEDIEEGRIFFRKMTEGYETESNLPPMDKAQKQSYGEDEFETPLGAFDDDFLKGTSISRDIFFMGVTIMALARSTKRNEVYLSWVHNGRETKEEMMLIGLMLEQYPLKWELDPEQTVGAFLRAVSERVDRSKGYRHALDEVYDSGVIDDFPTFILQKGAIGRRGMLKIGDAMAEIVDLPENEDDVVENVLDIEVNIHKEYGYSLVLDYDASCYTREGMEAFAADFAKIAEIMRDMERTVGNVLSDAHSL